LPDYRHRGQRLLRGAPSPLNPIRSKKERRPGFERAAFFRFVEREKPASRECCDLLERFESAPIPDGIAERFDVGRFQFGEKPPPIRFGNVQTVVKRDKPQGNRGLQ
jgi:hypothetical protein